MTREERNNAIKVLKNFDLNNSKVNSLLFSAEEITNAFDMAIEALEQQPYYNPDEWCHDCSEYNHDKHCCPRYNKVIRKTVEKIKESKTGHWISYWDEEARCYVYKCPECGNKQPFDTKHCWECGTKLSEIPAGSESEVQDASSD